MPDVSAFSRLLAERKSTDGRASSLAGALAAVETSLANDRPAAGPFLTVLLRTQGLRIEPLRDALLCLAAQTDRDFEVIVVGHDVAPEQSVLVQNIVDGYGDLLPSEPQFLHVHGGTRARPLNTGFDRATGDYVAVFDDDDLVFANWVEEFHRTAREYPGQLLRAQTATQQITAEVWHSGEDGFRTLSWPLAEYAPHFDQLDHLSANRSPFMSIAFPRRLFTDFGVRADELLDVCEDWDLILQGSFLLGVADVPAMTAVYHRWQSGASSYTKHSQAIWRESERRVLDKLDSSVLLLAPGQVHRIRSLLGDEGYRAEYERMVASSSWRVTGYLRDARRSTARVVARYRVRLSRVLKRRTR